MSQAFAYLSEPDLLHNLTERERDLIPHLIAGASDKEMSEALQISTQTVKAHLGKIYLAIGVRTRTGAAVYAATGWRPPNAPDPVRRRVLRWMDE